MRRLIPNTETDYHDRPFIDPLLKLFLLTSAHRGSDYNRGLGKIRKLWNYLVDGLDSLTYWSIATSVLQA